MQLSQFLNYFGGTTAQTKEAWKVLLRRSNAFFDRVSYSVAIEYEYPCHKKYASIVLFVYPGLKLREELSRSCIGVVPVVIHREIPRSSLFWRCKGIQRRCCGIDQILRTTWSLPSTCDDSWKKAHKIKIKLLFLHVRTYSHSRNTPTNITTTMPSMILWCQPDESEFFSLQTAVFDELDHNSAASLLRVLPRSWSEDDTTDSFSSSTTTRLSPARTNNSNSINDVLQERRPKGARNPLQDITSRTLNCRTLRSVNNNSNRR
jgi:hypothetical protein